MHTLQGSRREPLALRHSALVFWTVAVVTLGLDQASKALVRSRMLEGDSVALLDGVFQLTYVRNTGAAFGLFPGYQPIFVATSVVVLLVIAAYWRRSRPNAWPVVIALGFITGGAVGNLIDRALLGRVTDMFDLAFIDFPVFNVADSAIIVGVAMLVLWLLFVPEPQHPGDESAATDGDEPEQQSATPPEPASVGEQASGEGVAS